VRGWPRGHLAERDGNDEIFDIELPDNRLVVLKIASSPLVVCDPVMAALVLPFSRHLG
jgi:hypothetical protein